MDKKQLLMAGLGVALAVMLVFAGVVYKANLDLKEDVSDYENRVTELNENLDDVSEALDEVKAELDREKELGNELSDRVQQLREIKEELETEKEDLLARLEVAEQVDEPLEGYLLEGIELGDVLNVALDDGEVETLFDGEIEFDGEHYDTHEVIMLSDVAFMANGLGYDEELGSDVAFGFMTRGAVNYRYVFDDVIDVTEVDTDEPLVFEYMNRRWEVVDLDANEMTVRFGEKHTLVEDEELVVDDVTIKFVDASVDGETVLFDVNGELHYLDADDKLEVDGLMVVVDEIIVLNTQNKDHDIVKLYVGEDAEVTYDNAEPLVENPDWVLYWNVNGNDLDFVELTLDEKMDEVDDDYPPLMVGDELVFPWDTYAVHFVGLEEELSYVDINLYFDCEDAEDDLLVDTCGVWLEAGDDVFVVDNEEVSDVFLTRDALAPNQWGIYYSNEDGDFTLAVTGLVIEYEDTELPVVLETSGDKDIVVGDFRFDVRPLDQKLGDNEEMEEMNEVKYMGVGVGNMEYDVLSQYGLVLVNPEDNGEEDEAVLRVPSEQLTSVLRVY